MHHEGEADCYTVGCGKHKAEQRPVCGKGAKETATHANYGAEGEDSFWMD